MVFGYDNIGDVSLLKEIFIKNLKDYFRSMSKLFTSGILLQVTVYAFRLISINILCLLTTIKRTGASRLRLLIFIMEGGCRMEC